MQASLRLYTDNTAQCTLDPLPKGQSEWHRSGSCLLDDRTIWRITGNFWLTVTVHHPASLEMKHADRYLHQHKGANRMRNLLPLYARRVLTSLLFVVILAGVIVHQSRDAAPLAAGIADTRLNVRDFGAKGNGTTDDTAAIEAAIAAAPASGATIYFPPGTYLVGTHNIKGFQVSQRSGLRFEGEGDASVIKRAPLPGNTRIATFLLSTDIVLTRLTFDENGIENYGGVNLYAMKRVRIENTRHIDSAAKPIPEARTDRYAYVFGNGGKPSEDIVIRNNVIEDLQLEIDFARRVVISDNKVSRPCCTAGIGVFSLADGTVAEDYLIQRNTVIDPKGSAFVVDIDPPSTNNAILRRIKLLNNTVLRVHTNGDAFLIGTPNNSVETKGNIFDDIVIGGNRVEVGPAAPDMEPEQALIFVNSSVRAGVVFNRMVIRRNFFWGKGELAMDLRALRKATVAENDLRNVGVGIVISDGQRESHISKNLVGASGLAYYWGWSAGMNRFEGNRYFGTPREPLQVQEQKVEELVFKAPQFVPSPPPIPSPLILKRAK